MKILPLLLLLSGCACHTYQPYPQPISQTPENIRMVTEGVGDMMSAAYPLMYSIAMIRAYH